MSPHVQRLNTKASEGDLNLDCLRNLKSLGFKPHVVFDLGARIGDWTYLVNPIWPNAHYHCVDALEMNRIALTQLSMQAHAEVSYTIALLGPVAQPEVTFYEMDSGSSVYPETTTFKRTPITLPCRTLDSIAREHNFYGPYLLKLDVQGAELDVLKGAPLVLDETEVILLEVSLLPYNEGAPLFSEVVGWLDNHGFVAFDFCSQWRRHSDAVLFQTDMLFVRRNSFLRKHKKFFVQEP